MSDSSLPQSAALAATPPVVTLGIPKELSAGERRVAATPETAERLQKKLGFRVAIQSGAGIDADFPDAAYEAVGCKIVRSEQELFNESNIILKVRAPQPQEVDMLRPD